MRAEDKRGEASVRQPCGDVEGVAQMSRQASGDAADSGAHGRSVGAGTKRG